MRLTPAECLLQELGVSGPNDIDLDAIAHYLGVRVRYRPLDGCDARIVGVGNKAIVTVNTRSSPQRKRFSIAHELGHWKHHRGKSLVCRVDDYRPDHRMSTERVADRYAADLLMPQYLFKPATQQINKLTFAAIANLSKDFVTSLTSTAIRVVEADHSPAILVCHGQFGRKWFTRSPSVPERWFPKDALDAESSAMDVLYGRKPDNAHPRKIGADAWFDRREAERYEVLEQSVRPGSAEVLTLISITDGAMLEEEETWGYGRK
ncbi:MAG: ImmA/IrrE family metallo-endopeptidase [Enhydrobacter sp.]|nr:MAG: ImmA/IrrE family metallo-endopeptidase [Enhydrobacter sp.]